MDIRVSLKIGDIIVSESQLDYLKLVDRKLAGLDQWQRTLTIEVQPLLIGAMTIGEF